MLHTPLHAAGYMLDPEYLSHTDMTSVADVMKGTEQMIEKLVPPQKQAITLSQLYEFRLQKGCWQRAVVQNAMSNTSAHAFWTLLGSRAPELQSLAIQVLSQVSSASACERAWSAYAFIHDKKRNRLTASRASKLVWVFSNLRLVKSMQSLDCKEQFPEWDGLSDSE